MKERISYRESDYTSYKGFQIWGTGENWVIETDDLDPNSKEYWNFRNEQPELKTMREAKKWIRKEGINLIKKLKGAIN